MPETSAVTRCAWCQGSFHNYEACVSSSEEEFVEAAGTHTEMVAQTKRAERLSVDLDEMRSRYFDEDEKVRWFIKRCDWYNDRLTVLESVLDDADRLASTVDRESPNHFARTAMEKYVSSRTETRLHEPIEESDGSLHS